MTVTLGAPRWRGQSGRLEVWYLTATDASTGAGVWIHQETVAPTDGDPAYAHGWIAVFEPGTPPVLERFGPEPARSMAGPSGAGEVWHEVARCEIGPGTVRGAAGAIIWDLTYDDESPPLYTFPAWAWNRELLPGAQVVPSPDAGVRGTIVVNGRELTIDGGGALARINGHGSAQRWCWLHADLHGDGVLEIVSGSARRPGLRRVPPMAFVQLRLHGADDWPRRSLLAAPRFRTTLRADGFEVSGRHGGRELRVEVEIPTDARVDVRYRDPDGAEAMCRNSERATATITTSVDGASRSWRLDGTAHAEVGTRPPPD